MERCMATMGLIAALCACATTSGPPTGHLPDGRYAPTAQEQGLDCPRLTYLVTSGITSIKDLAKKAKAQRAEPPPTITSMFGRMFGRRGTGVAALQEIDRERARIEALNDVLGAKACLKIDIEAGLGDTRAVIAELKGG
jgi:hypothetical protein